MRKKHIFAAILCGCLLPLFLTACADSSSAVPVPESTSLTRTTALTTTETRQTETATQPEFNGRAEALLLAGNTPHTLLSSDLRFILYYQYEKRGNTVTVTTNITNQTSRPITLRGIFGQVFTPGTAFVMDDEEDGSDEITVQPHGQAEFIRKTELPEDAPDTLNLRYSIYRSDGAAEYHYTPQSTPVISLTDGA